MIGNRQGPEQLDLFAEVLKVYLDGEARTNDSLYEELVGRGVLSREELEATTAVGKAESMISLAKRRVRWLQQDLRKQGVLERLPESRGTWRIAERDSKDLTKAPPGVVMLGFSTELGVALWGSWLDVAGSLTDSIAVCITSPPYPLSRPRDYGNETLATWTDWMCRQLEPIVKRLLPGGSIAINISNDIFMPGLPARSTYRERFVIALEERLGLFKMDEVIWRNPNKPPSPYQWASRLRMQLNAGYEPVLVFCNDPLKSFADNRRVLEPHSEHQLKLIARGGEQRRRVNSNGAYVVREGAYGNETLGRIPRNVLEIGTSCRHQRSMRKRAKAAGLPLHGATMPLKLAIFLVKYLSRPGDLVIDPFGGSMTVGKACETLGRMWLASELVAEYCMQGRYWFDEGNAFSG